MSNRGRVRLIVADVDLHCEIVSAVESRPLWKLLALSDLDHVDCLCLPESRPLWKLLALSDLEHVDCPCLRESRPLWKLLALPDLGRVDCPCLRESRLLWKLFALPDLEHADGLCLRKSRLLWNLLALPDLEHADGPCLRKSRLLWKLPFFWRLKCCVPVMFFFLVASFSIPKKRWANWKHSVTYWISKNTWLIVILIFGRKSSLFESLSVKRGFIEDVTVFWEATEKHIHI